jgi:two-component system, chemotaxis family, sensor kinase CheA
MTKYRALFIEESREHLQAASKIVVELESEQTAARVDELFRHVHSMKGMAASMGYEPIATLAHRLEDVVAARRGSVMEKELIDLLLAGLDALSAQVEAIANETPLDPFVDVLRRLREAAGAKAEPAPAAPKRGRKKAAPKAPAAPSPAAAAPPPVVAPASGVQIRVQLDEATASRSLRAFMVYRKVTELTELIESRPKLDEIKADTFEGFALTFIVPADADTARIEKAVAALSDVERVTIASSATAEKPPAPPVEAIPVAELAAKAPGSATVRVRTQILDDLIDTVGELFIARERLRILLGGELTPEARAALDALGGRIRAVHDQVMTVRMTPLRTLTERYGRLLRDLGRRFDKTVDLEVHGADIEIDRAILEALDGPFVHVLRNAVDHGIESTAERVERGKPSNGKVTIVATRDRDTVHVVIEDDGRGLDSEALKLHAMEHGLIDAAQAEAMSAREAYFLICEPGFSTKREVSDVSGRGVGMDAVRSGIEELGGSLDIESELGRGTRFVLRLPLTLAIVPVLLVEASRRVFALPATKVVAVREPGEDVFEQAGGRLYLSFQHALVPITSLSEMLRLGRGGRIQQIVVLEDGRDLYGLAVDRTVGYQEVVVKPLGEPLERIEQFSGATVLGDGRPILILDLPKALRQRSAA